jgi:hypothetical protein
MPRVLPVHPDRVLANLHQLRLANSALGPIMQNPRSLDDMVADIARDTMKASALPKIVNHIRDYHLSLDKRLNGDVAD